LIRTLLLLGLLSTTALSFTQKSEETRIDIDLKEADVTDILRLLAEVGQFNLVADPEVECKLTLTLKSVTWPEVLDTALRACRLGQERMGKNLIRVAPLVELRREMEERRKYEEQKELSGSRRVSYHRLAYARAKEMAPLIRKFLSSHGEVLFDERTNTLIISDVAK
jgi:type IV pilus assembly protein PilQ